MVDQAPLVSISVTTYQHGPYLEACLESILMQRCDFAYEVLLGEDASTDGTREIAQRYAAAHPHRIRLFLHDRSQVIRIDGRVTGRHNFLNNLRHARGRYLCHIDGDDRWTDPDRLRIMVEKMEQEPDLGLAFHNAMNVWPNGRREPFMDPAQAQARYTRRDLTVRNFIPTAGVIWRWNGLRELPRPFRAGPFGDWVLNIHFAGTGPVGYVDRMMCERHVNPGSIMSVLSPIRSCRALALAYEVMHEQVGDDLATEALARWTKQVTDGFDLAYRAGEPDHARWFLRHAPQVPHGAVPLRMRLRWRALLAFPRLMAHYARVRN
jgi:glycosyltransferase involved in cell wall biosynthesis